MIDWDVFGHLGGTEWERCTGYLERPEWKRAFGRYRYGEWYGVIWEDRKGIRHLVEMEVEGLKFYLGRPVRLKAFAWYREGEGLPGYLCRHEWKKDFGMNTGLEEGTGLFGETGVAEGIWRNWT
jgi:hypothetical protein